MNKDIIYLYQQPNWPHFSWNAEALVTPLAEVRHAQGRLIGRMEALGFHLQSEAIVETLTEEIITSSSIEGEKLDREQVRSSIARKLGVNIGGLIPADRFIEGVVEMMLDATQHFDKPLTKARLFGWHSVLFPTGRSGLIPIRVGKWRNDQTGPMEVVSGPIGKEKVHFIAPEATQLIHEMDAFLKWFDDNGDTEPVLKAAIAHLWFVTIHPFDDGNGRIARAIADLQLARSEGIKQRFYSMSAQIRKERKAYYDILEQTQKGNLDISEWLLWFLACLKSAFQGAEITLDTVLRKARFWDVHREANLNDRQKKLLNRLFDGFDGKLTSSKWATICKCSQDTALRDINDLVEMRILTKDPIGSRSTSYSLAAY